MKKIFTDRRTKMQIKHSLHNISLIVIAASCAGAESYSQVYDMSRVHIERIKKHTNLEHGLPSKITLWRNFERIRFTQILEFIKCNQTNIEQLSKEMQPTHKYKNRMSDLLLLSEMESVTERIETKNINNIIGRIQKGCIVKVSKHNKILQIKETVNMGADYCARVHPSESELYEQVSDLMERYSNKNSYRKKVVIMKMCWIDESSDYPLAKTILMTQRKKEKQYYVTSSGKAESECLVKILERSSQDGVDIVYQQKGHLRLFEQKKRKAITDFNSGKRVFSNALHI